MAQLSVHFQKVDWDVRNVIMGSHNTEWVYIVDPPEENHFPGKKTIGRFYEKEEQGMVGLGEMGAEMWWARNAMRVQRSPYLHAVVVCNEPRGDWRVVNAYMARWIDLCNAKCPHLATVAGNFSTGTPEAEDAKFFAKSFYKATYYAFHEYWLPAHWLPEHAWARGLLMWRYKSFIKNLSYNLRYKPVFITECGCDGLTRETLGLPNTETGWIDYYQADRQAYAKDAYRYQDGLGPEVVAAFFYTGGPWERWIWYGVDAPLAQLLVAHNQRKEVDMGKTIVVKRTWGELQTLALEEYVKGVVPKEVYSTWPMEALKAQAVAARTYALASEKHRMRGDPYDVCDTTCCQVYGETRSGRCDEAVEATLGIVGVHRTRRVLVPTFFSSACGGHTRADWGDYLRVVDDCPCGAHGKAVNGHQNGLCQWGAKYLADLGWTYVQILNKYYDLDWVPDYGDNLPPAAPSDWQARIEARVAALEQRISRIRVQAVSVLTEEVA